MKGFQRDGLTDEALIKVEERYTRTNVGSLCSLQGAGSTLTLLTDGALFFYFFFF